MAFRKTVLKTLHRANRYGWFVKAIFSDIWRHFRANAVLFFLFTIVGIIGQTAIFLSLIFFLRSFAEGSTLELFGRTFDAASWNLTEALLTIGGVAAGATAFVSILQFLASRQIFRISRLYTDHVVQGLLTSYSTAAAQVGTPADLLDEKRIRSALTAGSMSTGQVIRRTLQLIVELAFLGLYAGLLVIAEWRLAAVLCVLEIVFLWFQYLTNVRSVAASRRMQRHLPQGTREIVLAASRSLQQGEPIDSATAEQLVRHGNRKAGMDAFEARVAGTYESVVLSRLFMALSIFLVVLIATLESRTALSSIGGIVVVAVILRQLMGSLLAALARLTSINIYYPEAVHALRMRADLEAAGTRSSINQTAMRAWTRTAAHRTLDAYFEGTLVLDPQRPLRLVCARGTAADAVQRLAALMGAPNGTSITSALHADNGQRPQIRCAPVLLGELRQEWREIVRSTARPRRLRRIRFQPPSPPPPVAANPYWPPTEGVSADDVVVLVRVLTLAATSTLPPAHFTRANCLVYDGRDCLPWSEAAFIAARNVSIHGLDHTVDDPLRDEPDEIP